MLWICVPISILFRFWLPFNRHLHSVIYVFEEKIKSLPDWVMFNKNIFKHILNIIFTKHHVWFEKKIYNEMSARGKQQNILLQLFTSSAKIKNENSIYSYLVYTCFCITLNKRFFWWSFYIFTHIVLVAIAVLIWMLKKILEFNEHKCVIKSVAFYFQNF